MSAILDNGLEVTALHNHFFWEQPRIFYMHVHGTGTAADIAKKLQPAINLIDDAAKRGPPAPAGPAPAGATGTPPGENHRALRANRRGLSTRSPSGARTSTCASTARAITARMGLNTWAAFAGTDADAMVAGDVAMLEHEVQPVLKALRSNGIDVVAIHHHMTDVKPTVIFLHYFGTGPAEKLATGLRAAVAQLGKGPVPGR